MQETLNTSVRTELVEVRALGHLGFDRLSLTGRYVQALH